MTWFGPRRLQIEDISPALVGGKGVLSERLQIAARSSGMPEQETEDVLSSVPLRLLEAGCFLDVLTGFWRYEFGHPIQLDGSGRQLWGTHMWPVVDVLLRAVRCASQRLSEADRRSCFARLNNPESHGIALAEFAPVVRLPQGVRATYEASTGVGNATADWLIESPGATPVLCEVKKRKYDLIEHGQAIAAMPSEVRGDVPAPTHDAGGLFRSVQKKFPEADPAEMLQGVWVFVELQQPREEVEAAFAALDAGRVHFAILGDWEPGIWLLTRRVEDRATLLALWSEREDERHVFRRAT